MDKNDLKQNILSVQLDYFIERNAELRQENERLKALIAKHFDENRLAIELIDKTLSENHGR